MLPAWNALLVERLGPVGYACTALIRAVMLLTERHLHRDSH